MMISTTSDYGLRLMIALAEAPTSPVKSDEIARAAHLPHDYSVKVLQMLERADFVVSQRGRNGGFSLTCDPANVSLFDVINAISPVKRRTCCPGARAGDRVALCPLHRRIDAVHRNLLDGLRRTMLQDVIDGGPGPALCRPDAAETPEPIGGRTGRAAAPHAGPER